jgi:hypothetical protein
MGAQSAERKGEDQDSGFRLQPPGKGAGLGLSFTPETFATLNPEPQSSNGPAWSRSQ